MLCLLSFPARATRPFTDLDAAGMHSGAGALSLRVRRLADNSPGPHNPVIMLAITNEATERFEIKLLADKMNVRRYFGGCLLTAFFTDHHFEDGNWHTLALSWNQGSTSFSIDGKDVPKHAEISGDDLPPGMRPGIRLGRAGVEVVDFAVASKTTISQDPEERKLLTHAACPGLNKIVTQKPLEVYRGVALQHFPNARAMKKTKEFIDMLPEMMLPSIAQVIVQEDEHFAKTGEGGEALLRSKTLVVEGSLYDRPDVWFHEAAHLHDSARRLSLGVPDAQSQWATISGVSCYYKGADMTQFEEDFQKTHVQNGILAAQGGQCAPEDLAIWVGAVYDSYIKGRRMTDLLDPKRPKYSDKNRRKLDFLYANGFFTQKVYDAVAPK